MCLISQARHKHSWLKLHALSGRLYKIPQPLGWWSCGIWDGLRLKLSTLRKKVTQRVIRSGSVASKDWLNYYFENMSSVQTDLLSSFHKSIPAPTFRSNLSCVHEYLMLQPSHLTMVFLQKENQPATVHQGINSVKPKQSVYLPILFPRDKRKKESQKVQPGPVESPMNGWMDKLQTARSGRRSFTNQKYFVLIIQGVSKSMFSIFCRYVACSVPPFIHGWFIETDLGQRSKIHKSPG